MDIIAAHQQGLIEQLEVEVKALAGRPRDHGQRAVVLHHLYNHSRGAHEWALAEARRALHIVRSLVALERRLDRWGWLAGNRSEAKAALARLAEALGHASHARCADAYRAYRLAATPALRSEVEHRMPAELLAALDHCHAARRSGEPMGVEARRQFAEQTELHVSAAIDADALDLAWRAIESTSLKRAAQRLLGSRALARRAARDQQRGWARVEMELLRDPLLPARFRANPAQHFYALQHEMVERRRQQWREACDREPDAFELAA
jgi:hypothetical protein